MYQKINIVPTLVHNAEQYVIDNDRMLYAPFFKILEKYCANGECVLGGKIGIDLLTGVPLHKDSFMWEIYTYDTFNVAKSIAREFHSAHAPHIDTDTCNVVTNIRNVEQSIQINGRTIVKIYKGDRYRSVDLLKMLRPVQLTGYFGDLISCVGEESQLSDIYQTLYSPSKFDAWESAFKNESKLFTKIEDNMQQYYLGAGRLASTHVSERNQLLAKALGRDNIIIGSVAMQLMGISSNIQRLQIITQIPVQDLMTVVKRILMESRSNSQEIKLSYVEYKLHLVSDFRLTKYTIYVVHGSKDRSPIMDVYNSTQYELVPFSRIDASASASGGASSDHASSEASTNEILCGNLWVLLRFKMVDAWSVKLIVNMQVEQSANAEKSLTNIVDDIKALRAVALDTPLEQLFPLEDYKGSYISERISRKKLLEDIGERFTPFYPALEKQYQAAPAEGSSEH